MKFLMATVAASILAGIGIGLAIRAYRGTSSSLTELIALSVMGGFLGCFLSLPVSFLLDDILAIPASASVLQLVGAMVFASVFSFVLNWKYQGKL